MADIVVSNADAGHTYTHLLRGHKRARWTDKKMESRRWSMGLFVWYFGTKGTRGEWKDVGHHTIVNGPRYEALLKDIFVKGKLADDFSLYIHRPSLTDPTVAPDGDDSFYVLSPVPHLGHKNGVDWERDVEAYRTKVSAVLEQHIPGFADKITEQVTFTPEDFRDRYLSPNGSGFSLEPRILQSAWFRPHNVSEEVSGLFLAGAGTHPGAGVPGVVSSAEVLAKMVPDVAPSGVEPVLFGKDRPMIAPADLEHCKEAIRHGSLSFHAASKLLPAKVRDPALALYAFCRLADDAVDLNAQKAAAVLRLQERLDRAL
jgi:phytoene desaturase